MGFTITVEEDADLLSKLHPVPEIFEAVKHVDTRYRFPVYGVGSDVQGCPLDGKTNMGGLC